MSFGDEAPFGDVLIDCLALGKVAVPGSWVNSADECPAGGGQGHGAVAYANETGVLFIAMAMSEDSPPDRLRLGLSAEEAEEIANALAG